MARTILTSTGKSITFYENREAVEQYRATFTLETAHEAALAIEAEMEDRRRAVRSIRLIVRLG